MNLTHKTPWDKLPLNRKLAIVELRREMREQNPDPYQESLNQFRREQRERSKRIKGHVAKLMEMRHA